MKNYIRLVVCLVIIGCGIQCRSDDKAGKIKNVVLISIDTCRSDYLSCYGYDAATTPNIDALAVESTLFENVYTPVPLTLPAHSSMLTGTIPPYHGIHDNLDYQLDPANHTLAEMFKENGYTTGAVVSTFVLDRQFGLDQGFDTYIDDLPEGKGSASERKAGDTTALANQWLEQHGDEPFFLFIHYYDPHTVYEPPEPFASKFAHNLYAGEIAYTDYCIGQVIQTLKQLDLYDNTLLIVTGDHGELLGEHGEDTHAFFIYESAIRVPLIIHLPGQTACKSIEEFVGLIDIVPTVCRLTDMDIPAAVAGRDLSGYFKETTATDMEMVPYYCESLYPTKYGGNSLLGILSKPWKYIQTTRPELYDLANDPNEQDNLIDQQPHRARILQDGLKQILEQNVRKDQPDREFELDEAARRRLESLGYMGGAAVTESFAFDQEKTDPKDLIELHELNTEAAFLASRGEYEQAKTLCEEMIREKPDYFDGYHQLAKVYIKQNQFSDALEPLEKAHALKPDSYAILNDLGVVSNHLGNYQQALEYLKKAMAMRSESWRIHSNLAHAYAGLKDANNMGFHCRKAIEFNPEDPDLYRQMGFMFLRADDYHNALINFEQSIDLKPNQPSILNKLGDIYFARNDLGQSLDAYTRSITSDPNQPNIFKVIGDIYFQKNQWVNALDYWQKAIAIKPNMPVVLNNLAWIKATSSDANMFDPHEAIRLGERSIELSDANAPGLLDTLSVAYAAAGQFEKAIETAQKALDFAKAADNDVLIKAIKEHLKLYRSNKKVIQE